MADKPIRMGSLSTTRAQMIDLLRRSAATAAEIAAGLGMTYHAVRPHLVALQRDGLVRVAGVQRGTTRPSAVYELAPGVEAAMSRAYVPFASHLMRVLAERLPERRLDDIMRDVGRGLATAWPRPRGTLPQRVEAVAALLQELGALNEIERDATTVRIRGFGCLLAQAIHGRPAVCHAMETLLGELLDADVRERCDRGDRPRCCFEVKLAG